MLERNASVFGGSVKSARTLIEAITAGIRARVCSWKDYPTTGTNKELCQRWGFSLKVLGSDHDLYFLMVG